MSGNPVIHTSPPRSLIYSSHEPNRTAQCLPNCPVNIQPEWQRNTLGLTPWRLARWKRCSVRQRCVTGCSSPSVSGETRRGTKSPVVWGWCGVTLTQSSPETLHPWLQVTAPADWYPAGILWLYQLKNLNFVNGNTHRWWHVPTQLHSSSHYSHSSALSNLQRQIIRFITEQLDDLQIHHYPQVKDKETPVIWFPFIFFK